MSKRTVGQRHECRRQFPSDCRGSAIDDCMENEHGEFWAGNGEYGTQVPFCPFCGAEAPSGAIDLAEVEYTRTIPGTTLRLRHIPTGTMVTVPIVNGCYGTAQREGVGALLQRVRDGGER